MKYLKEINKRFNVINIIFNSIILAVIVFLLDYYNVPSFIYCKNKVITIVLSTLIILFCIKEIVNRRLYKLFLIKTINYFDRLLFGFLGCELVLFVYYFFYTLPHLSVIILSYFFTVIAIIIRLYVIERLINKSQTKDTNTYSISDLYNKKIGKEKLVLLEEKAISSIKDDLLNINLFVNSIEDNLLLCKPKENYVIALTGKWGCGKTSVINMLKNKINNNNNDEAIIDVFNPWVYDNKLSLFKGFYNYLFNLFGKNYGYINYKEIFKKYENIVFNLVQNKTNISLNQLFIEDVDKDVKEIKNSINDCINFNDRKIVVVIDDIDRLDKEQILLVFKSIKTLFDFNNIVYVLCYDDQRINRIFNEELKIDSDYINKIVQNKIAMPKIENSSLIDIGKTCILNLLDIYDIKNYNSALLNTDLNIIFKDFHDLREIIRFINSISISIKWCNELNLDICDYIALEYIKFKDLSFYNIIYDNSKMFVSEDREQNIDYDWDYASTFNTKAKDFYSTIFKDKENIKELLSKVFPYIDNYSRNYEIRYDGLLTSDDRKKTIISNRCCNGRYFKCFFTIKHSFFTELNILLTNFINRINKNDNISKAFSELIEMVNPDNHDMLFELMEIRINEIKNKEIVFNYILESINNYEDNPRFLSLTSNSRAKILLAAIISSDDNETKRKEYLNKIYQKDLLVLDSVLYWLGTDKYGRNKEDSTYLYAKEILCNQLREDIKIKRKIFDDMKCSKHYCWLFSKHLENSKEYISYLTKLINKKNVFRVIYEGISTWVGSGISYEYKASSLEKLVELKKVDDILKKVDYSLNEDQNIVLELYQNPHEKEESLEINYDNL